VAADFGDDELLYPIAGEIHREIDTTEQHTIDPEGNIHVIESIQKVEIWIRIATLELLHLTVVELLRPSCSSFPCTRRHLLHHAPRDSVRRDRNRGLYLGPARQRVPLPVSVWGSLRDQQVPVEGWRGYRDVPEL
jgi:hypothetical protein